MTEEELKNIALNIVEKYKKIQESNSDNMYNCAIEGIVKGMAISEERINDFKYLLKAYSERLKTTNTFNNEIISETNGLLERFKESQISNDIFKIIK